MSSLAPHSRQIRSPLLAGIASRMGVAILISAAIWLSIAACLRG